MDETVVHCNVKANAELIADILNYDISGEEYPIKNALEEYTEKEKSDFNSLSAS